MTGSATRWLGRLAALLAFVAQIAVVALPIAEGREGPSAPAHVERGGTSLHFAHNEDACAACQVRTLFGHTSAPFVGAPAALLVAAPPVARAIAVVAAAPATHHLSRAPPPDIRVS